MYTAFSNFIIAYKFLQKNTIWKCSQNDQLVPAMLPGHVSDFIPLYFSYLKVY